MRAMVMGGWYSGPIYGRIMGTQWTAVVLVGASGPVLVAVLRDATGGYQTSFVVLAAFFVVAAVAIVASYRADTE
jgi:cyanate permease